MRPQHSCDSLGMCQSRTPRCNGCSVTDHDYEPTESPLDWIERISVVGVVGVVGVVAIAIACAAVMVGTAAHFWR